MVIDLSMPLSTVLRPSFTRITEPLPCFIIRFVSGLPSPICGCALKILAQSWIFNLRQIVLPASSSAYRLRHDFCVLGPRNSGLSSRQAIFSYSK
jgi:hypothetical protein